MKNLLKDEQIELLELFKKAQQQNKSILTMSEAAEFMGLSMSYLYKLTHWNKIPYYKPSGKIVYFKKEDLEDWMLQNRSTTEKEIEAIVDEELKNTGK
ncbi:helix-turn-helix domain-containing protein [Marivirga tractuosa]|uniref:helix-turn-helix domain-containing protein n=1 Tax=Marivirga tractuosa TaxID=1006 RepID=UPI0035D07B6D